MKSIFFFLLFLFFLACNSKKENLKTEKEIFEDNLTAIIESHQINKYHCNENQSTNSKNLIFINEYPGNIFSDDKESIRKNFKMLSLSDKLKLDLKKYNGKLYEIKPLSEIPKDENADLYVEKLEDFYGIISFGNLFLDKTKQNGIIPLYYSCNSHSISSYFIYLIKQNGIWKINKIKQNWIS